MSKILDGKKLSDRLTPGLIRSIGKRAVKPKLVIIQIGNDERSNIYIKNKVAFGRRIGAIVRHMKYSNTVLENKIIYDISKLNNDRKVHGIIVQLPIPKHLDQNRVVDAIRPLKDIDGLTATNIRSLFNNEEAFVPATTKGILSILDHYKVSLKGKKVVIVGESSLVGRPTAFALLNKRATVTICHNATKDLKSETKRADILITAVGQSRFITKSYVAEGQIVIDIGITVDKNAHISGDIDFEKVALIVKAITPVPGGVGPMTVFSLFENLVKAYLLNSSNR